MNTEYKSSESCQADLKNLSKEYNLSSQLNDALVHLVENSYNLGKEAMLIKFSINIEGQSL